MQATAEQREDLAVPLSAGISCSFKEGLSPETTHRAAACVPSWDVAWPPCHREVGAADSPLESSDVSDSLVTSRAEGGGCWGHGGRRGRREPLCPRRPCAFSGHASRVLSLGLRPPCCEEAQAPGEAGAAEGRPSGCRFHLSPGPDSARPPARWGDAAGPASQPSPTGATAGFKPRGTWLFSPGHRPLLF